jgi:hypothetical protein
MTSLPFDYCVIQYPTAMKTPVRSHSLRMCVYISALLLEG